MIASTSEEVASKWVEDTCAYCDEPIPDSWELSVCEECDNEFMWERIIHGYLK